MALTKCKECGTEVSTSAKACPKCGAPPKKPTSLFTWFVTIALVIGAIGMFSQAPTTSQGSSSSSAAPRPPSPKQAALDGVTLDFSWRKEGFDNVMEADFSIHNTTKFDVKDVAIECVHVAKSGTVIDRNERTVYEIVKASTTKKVEKFNMGFIHPQAASSSCSIKDLVVVTVGK